MLRGIERCDLNHALSARVPAPRRGRCPCAGNFCHRRPGDVALAGLRVIDPVAGAGIDAHFGHPCPTGLTSPGLSSSRRRSIRSRILALPIGIRSRLYQRVNSAVSRTAGTSTRSSAASARRERHRVLFVSPLVAQAVLVEACSRKEFFDELADDLDSRSERYTSPVRPWHHCSVLKARFSMALLSHLPTAISGRVLFGEQYCTGCPESTEQDERHFQGWI